MSDYIDRIKTINALNEAQIEYDEYYKGLGKAKEIVDSLPTLNFVEELEKIKAKMEDLMYNNGNADMSDLVDILDEHISELKGDG